MNKKIAVLYYTQSGQLGDIVKNFIQPFEEAGCLIDKIRLDTDKKFSFPWSSASFFDAMPESVQGAPTPLSSFHFKENTYDLIILGYQPWFLSPSIPTTSLLLHPAFAKIAAHTPVITLIGSRNMWLNAQEQVKAKLQNIQASLVGNVAFFDRHLNSISAVTIMYWAFTGKKDRFLNIFPKPGVADDDIEKASVFGQIALTHLQQNTLSALQEQLIQAKAVEVKTNLMFIEGRAKRLFAIWAAIVMRAKNRKRALFFYKYYLIVALFAVAPLVLLIYRMFFAPFLTKQIRNKKNYFLGIK
ncbi:MAG: hypothetical protein JST67_05950 [Bacteroidetes bacterium]|nr:hypothetical protein [Bacteroidota bacterium]